MDDEGVVSRKKDPSRDVHVLMQDARLGMAVTPLADGDRLVIRSPAAIQVNLTNPSRAEPQFRVACVQTKATGAVTLLLSHCSPTVAVLSLGVSRRDSMLSTTFLLFIP